jgi:hypothetical protein
VDDDIRYKETDTPTIPKNWNLSDDLGINPQIGFIIVQNF